MFGKLKNIAKNVAKGAAKTAIAATPVGAVASQVANIVGDTIPDDGVLSDEEILTIGRMIERAVLAKLQ